MLTETNSVTNTNQSIKFKEINIMNDITNLLDVTLDDLADLPSYTPFPIGTHRVTASFEVKEVQGKPTVELSFTYIEPIELANPEDAAPVAGDECSTMFFIENEYAQGNLKLLAAPFEELAGSRNLGAIVEAVTDVECLVVTSLRADKKDPSGTKFYLDVKDIAPV